MMMVKIDDLQLRQFLKNSPKRAKWAVKESFLMAGGHYRARLRAFVESQIAGLVKLHPVTEKGRKGGAAPLHNIGKWVSFKYGIRERMQTVRIGWIGKGQQAMIRKLFYGKRFRATPKIRALFHYRGVHLKKTTKMLEAPKRPALDMFFKKEERGMLKYFEKRFFEKFFGNQRPDIRI